MKVGVVKERPIASHNQADRPRLAVPGLLLGMGLGGFVDGIVFHQLLQWHHILSDTGDSPITTVEGLEKNTLADGLFHTFTWILVALGLVMLWRISHRGVASAYGRSLVGWTLAGWGLFNLVEGVVSHHILQIHHVRDDVSNSLPWDIGFLVSGVLLLIVGRALTSKAPMHRRRSSESGDGRA